MSFHSIDVQTKDFIHMTVILLITKESPETKHRNMAECDAMNTAVGYYKSD
jgi:hypothetical protein